MRFGFRQRHLWTGGGRFVKLGHVLKRASEFLQIPAPDAPQLIRRIELMEREIVLPIKAAVIVMLLQSFYLTPSPWIGSVLSALDIAVESTQYFVWVYIAINIVIGTLLLGMHRVPLAVVEWAVFGASLVDGIFLGALTLVSGGYDSPLYWLFLALIVRSAVSVPRATSQLMLSFTLSACYVLAGLIDVAVAENLEEPIRRWVDLSGPENVAEPLFLRLILLLLMSVCCYGVQVLFERQRKALEEAREFALREGQLRSAGRLAAEFAHQIKNPLAIINNAAYSLERALRQGKRDVKEHIQIIQEEVERSDRIITDIMGYAQLSEGRVEKLSLREELDHAVDRVYPPGAGYPVRVHRDCQEDFPPLLMHRRHLTETLINILQNARDALGEQGGNVFVRAQLLADNIIEISIRDDGPGIPPDKQERIFEAYYTTREKGTGLGLATVKHNVELYGGKVRVESALGKGACFTVTLPAKSVPKSANSN